MNCFPPSYRGAAFRTGALLSLCLLALAFPSPAQTNSVPAARTNRPASERFLLIVETSAAMQQRAANVQRIVSHLFSSGLTAEMHPGDTIGVWTYDNELHTGAFPLQRWQPQVSREIAIKLVQFIQQQRYAKPSRLAPVMAQLTNVVADSEKITVLLFSDGSEPLVGTPFDAQIAEAFKLNAAEQRQQAMPFVTVLRAVRGKFVSLRVNTPPWPVELPDYPGETVPVAPTATATPTNPPSPKLENPPPLPPVAVPEPLPATVSPTNAAPPATNLALTPVAPPKPGELPTNPPRTVAVTPAPVTSSVAPAQVAPTNPAPASPTAPGAPVVRVKQKLPLLPILIGAAIVTVGLAVLCLVLLGRSRKAPRVSLITRSMNKDGK